MAEKDEKEVRFEGLSSIRRVIELLRYDVLCSASVENLSPFAEQHVLLGQAALEAAERHFALADLHEARALADFHLGRR